MRGSRSSMSGFVSTMRGSRSSMSGFVSTMRGSLNLTRETKKCLGP
jgi:hypothetical protein